MKSPPMDPWAPGIRGVDVPIAGNINCDPLFPSDDDNAATKPSTDIDSHRVTVTLFRNEAAQSKRTKKLTLPQLAELIKSQTAASKMELEWLKLAIFGGKKSDKGCVRNNQNVLEVSGVEGDHDTGELSFDDAVAKIHQAGIRALLYTSASFVPGTKERWRILVPLSKNYPPASRGPMIARINGLLDGHLAGESFVLSQAYLFGSVNSNPDHRVEIIDGDFLDLRDDTYAGSIFKDGGKVDDQGGDTAAMNGDSYDFNDTGLLSRGGDDPAPVEISKIEAALDVISADCSYLIWLKIAGGLHHQLGEHGFPLFDRWSSRATGTITNEKGKEEPRYTPEKSRERWRGARTMKDVTIATVFHFANAADPAWRARYEDDERRRIYADLGAGGGDGGGGGPDPRHGSDPGPQSGPSPGPKPQPGQLQASPYIWTEPDKIPQRDWLYGRLLIRKFVTATISPGGVGKSSLVVAEALAQVTGKDLLGVDPRGELRVWVLNLEDPAEEMTRKLQAAAKHYGLSKDDIGDRLFVDSGRDQEFVIAKMEPHGGPRLVIPVLKSIVAEIIKRGIDILVVDPFVSSHEVPENDNTAQDMVVKAWGRVADLGNCAVHLIDHTRKMGSETEVTTESSRGAKAKTDAARVVRVVNRMTEVEGSAAGVDNHRLHFRTHNDKANLAPPADKSDWFQLQNVSLGNAPGIDVGGVHYGGAGDAVGVVTGWTWPDPLAGMTGQHFERVAAVIRSGKWRADIRASAWVGHAVAQALGLSVEVKKDKAKIKGMVEVWLKAGSLVKTDRLDEHRELKQFVELAEDAD